MWILMHLIPDALIVLVSKSLFVVGIIGALIVGFIPIFPYKTALHFFSVIMLISSVYIYSSYEVEMKWRDDIKKNEEKIKEIEENSKVVTKKIIDDYEIKIKDIQGTTHVITKTVKHYITKKSDDACKLSNSFVWMHDTSAKNKVPDTATSIDETASGIELSTASEIIFSNYGKYHEVAQQLISLQSWVKEQEKTMNE